MNGAFASHRRHTDDVHAASDKRLLEVRACLDAFLLELAQTMAGHAVSIDHATGEIAGAVRHALQPLLESPFRADPDFGQFAEVRVDGDLSDVTSAVVAEVRFEDRTSLQHAGGSRLAAPRRQVELTLQISGRPPLVQRCGVHVLSHA